MLLFVFAGEPARGWGWMDCIHYIMFLFLVGFDYEGASCKNKWERCYQHEACCSIFTCRTDGNWKPHKVYSDSSLRTV